MEHQPKISLVEAFILLSYIGLTDVVGLVLVLFGLDDFFILDILTFPVTQIYFRMKGIPKAGYDVAGNVAELIPYLGALPIRTLGVALVIWADRHPSGVVAQTVAKAAKATPTKPTGIKTPVGELGKTA